MATKINESNIHGSIDKKNTDKIIELLYFLSLILVWMLTCNNNTSNFIFNHRVALVIFFLFSLVALYSSALIQYKKNSSYNTQFLLIILFGSFLFQALATITMPYNVTKHDIGLFIDLQTEGYGAGHAGLIEYLFENTQLIDFDPKSLWGFYNPPLYHILCAVILKITSLFGVPQPLIYESIQLVNLCCSTLSVFLFYQILKLLVNEDIFLYIVLTIFAFHPFLLIMASTTSNDCLAMFFMLLAILYALRWWQNHSYKNIIIIALAIGFAMETKLNSALISFGIGYLFFVALMKNKEKLQLITQYIFFICICAPLGLYYSIRNLIKFNIPLGFIQKMSMDSPQLIKNGTLWDYLGIPSLEQLMYPFLKFDPILERNIWLQTIRTSLFDEMTPFKSELVNHVMLLFLIVSIFLAIMTLYMFFKMTFKHNKIQVHIRIMLLILYLTLIMAYIIFCIKEPFICTMNYRYISITMIFPLIGLAHWLQESKGLTKLSIIAFIGIFLLLSCITLCGQIITLTSANCL